MNAVEFVNAARYGHIDEVRRGLAQGLVDIQNKNGSTAMMMAAYTGKIDIVELLISEGGNLDIQNEYGDTAMMWAAKNGNIDIVELLISKGGNPSIRVKYGKSAMDYLKEKHPSKVNEVKVSRLSMTNFHQFLHAIFIVDIFVAIKNSRNYLLIFTQVITHSLIFDNLFTLALTHSYLMILLLFHSLTHSLTNI